MLEYFLMVLLYTSNLQKSLHVRGNVLSTPLHLTAKVTLQIRFYIKTHDKIQHLVKDVVAQWFLFGP